MEHLTAAEALEALDGARAPETDALASALADHQFVGVAGPAESGKSKLLRRVLAPHELSDETAVVSINLDGAHGARHLAHRWLRAVARAAAGPIAFSHIAGMQRETWPGRTRRADHEARDVLRGDYEVALAPRATGAGLDADAMERAIAATKRLARGRATVVVVDHLEAPELSGAFDVGDVLWQLRAASQRTKGMAVVVACRPGAVALAAGEDAAFYGDGIWVTISPPTPETWRFATGGWDRIDGICDLTNGHAWTTATLVDRISRSPRLSTRRAFEALAAEQDPLAARCVQHSASLHRLGPTLMLGIANGLGPYQAAPDAQSRDVAIAAQRLELAGLAYRPQQRVWRLVNPVVARALHDPDLPGAER